MTGIGAQRGVFYGWFVLAAAFFALFMSTGTRNGFGVFIIPLTDEFGWSRGALSLAIAIGWLLNGLSQPFLGRLYDRLGGRTVISISLLVLGGATMLLSQTNSLWFLVVVYGVVISVATGGASLVTIHAVLSRWFYRRRGVALSISTAGASAGSMVLTPFTAYLILLAGWRTSWIVLGAMILVLAVPVAFLMIRNDPADMGEAPDGDGEPMALAADGKSGTPRAPLETEGWQASFGSLPIWQMSGAYFVCGMTTAIVSAHYVPFAIDRGASPGMAATAFGMMTGLNVLGVIAVGLASDRFARKYLLASVYAVRGLAYAMLILAPGMWGIWAFAFVAGFSWIASAPLTSSLTADIYGLRNLGTLSGMSTLAHQIGGALSIWLAGAMYDIFDSYDVPFAIAGSFLVLASIASWSIREKQYSSRFQTASGPVTTAGVVAGGH